MQLFQLDTTDPALNLACEEILTRQADAPLFLLWRNAPSIIIGCNQNTAAEIDEEFVKSKKIQVVRRITGGGAVYHDLGNVNYSCITPERIWTQESAMEFTRPVLQALQELGLQAEFSGRNDILAGGCKISGCARSVTQNHTLFHGTLLFHTDLNILSRALRPDPEKIRSKGIRSVRARVGNIRGMLPVERQQMNTADFLLHLTRSISRFYAPGQFQPLSSSVLQAASELADRKYRSWEWNVGTSMAYEVRKRCRFSGGILQAEFNVRNNRICQLRLTGDFFGERPISELTAQLNGLPPRQEALLERLIPLPLQEFIAGITPGELARLLSL